MSPVKPRTTAPMNPALVKVEPAPILDAPISDADLTVPLPPEVAGAKNYNEVTSDLEPTVKFTALGQYVLGRFDGLREMTLPDTKSPTGKRQQYIYYLKLGDGRRVGVWGSTILDRMMADAIRSGLATNQSLMIQYVRDIQTDQPSPAKDFRVIYK